MVRLLVVGVVVALAGCLDKPPFGGDDGGDDGGGLDEDRDGTLNAVDPCPHLDKAIDDRDGDGDGIGDGCDPEPGPQNTRMFFEGFDTAMCGAGNLTHCDAGTIDTARGWYEFGSDARGAMMFAGDHGRYMAEIGFDVTGRDPNDSYNEIGLVLCGRPSTVEPYVQGVYAIVGKSSVEEYVELFQDSDALPDEAYGHQKLAQLDLGGAVLDLRIACQVDLPSITCGLVFGGTTAIFSSSMIGLGAGQIGVSARSFDVRVRYIDVVALAP